MYRMIVLQSLFMSAVVAQPQVTVVNSASFASGMPLGGALATILTTGATGAPGTYIASAGQPLPYALAGISIFVNGGLGPILAVVIGANSRVQINFQVPIERNASLFGSGFTGTVAIVGLSLPVSILLPQLPEWGGFFGDGSQNAIALHASDGTLVTPQNPAHAGERIITYADDFFPVWPPPPLGIATPQQPVFQLANPFSMRELYNLYLQSYPTPTAIFPVGPTSCTNTAAIQVTFAGLAAGMTGVEEIDFIVPVNQAPGTWALFFNFGSKPDGSGCPSGTVGSSSPFVLLPVG